MLIDFTVSGKTDRQFGNIIVSNCLPLPYFRYLARHGPKLPVPEPSERHIDE